MVTRADGDCWIRRISIVLVLVFILGTGTKPAEARFFQDPSPRVAERMLPVQYSNQVESTVYIVKSGDSLSTIARRFQVDLQQLVSWNNIKDPNRISVGQMLTIPAVGAGDRQPVVYQIKSGDTLWDIARMYDTDIEAIVSANQLKNPDQLAIGSQLIIPVNGRVTATAGGVTVTAMSSAVNVNTVASFEWPLQGIITSQFGRRWGEFHYGLDIAADMGTPVRAAAAGVVIAADWRGTYGKAVIIQHNDEYRTLYAHNSELLVKEGDRVSRGQIIARVGSTGRSTGPHLHFEVHFNDKAMDPMRYLSKY